MIPSNKKEVYSTEEVRIGTWIDGKPLYRKVVTGISTIVDTVSIFEHGITDYESIFIGGESHFLVNNIKSKTIPVNYPALSTENYGYKVCRTTVENDNILLYGGGWMVGNSFTYNIVLYYTKTTD